MSDGPGGEGSEGERARLFVALGPPAEVRAALAEWAGKVSDDLAAMRVLRPESLHVTLCFLGELELAEVPALSAAIEEVAADCGERIMLAPAEALALPRRRPRVFALGLHDVGGRGAALQAALAARLQAGRWYAPEGRPWLAHVTVARRGRARRDVERPVGEIPDLRALTRADLSLPRLHPFTAEAVVLLRSWPGSRYETLARIAL